MTASNSRFYLDYLDKLVDEHNNTSIIIMHRSIGKKI